ncbi:DUF4433 domain-containing protein [Shinella yambaruensis]|nr:DarT ssDNA thymidine ADP-ribosyltransferase family protein [Shinella yambaruensis]MCJ8028252.1 DUF4433 domain-containing protein [Shinella yambaruensis]MCU7980266.1 DUF4433 domain-containing protein [Shinella yambaruensis]
MAISVDRANAHVAYWRERLERFSTRAGWASSLFHACQIEVAERIIRDGRVICRQDLPNVICDVANQGALWNNLTAHQYVRLYFRPRNRFHLKTEGIKSLSDNYRIDPHMAIPIMFVFDLVSVLSDQSSYFVPGNFASTAMQPLSGNESFDALNFEYIYHDSAPSPDIMHMIQDARMAEVVVLNSLTLQHLKAVVCRTIYEEQMLRHMLRDFDVSRIKFITERGGALFFRRGIFLSELYVSQGNIHFTFQSPTTAIQPDYKVKIGCENVWYDFKLGAKKWRVPQITNTNPNAIWTIYIEDCLAFQGPVRSASGTVV